MTPDEFLTDIPRLEYPRPQFQWSEWINLRDDQQ
jgi:hypothetical protein